MFILETITLQLQISNNQALLQKDSQRLFTRLTHIIQKREKVANHTTKYRR